MTKGAKSNDDCKPCKKGKPVSARKKPAGLLSTILLIVLPKCPFCVMAFSSTFILCGKAGGVSEQTHSYLSPATIFITSILCLLVLLSIAFNYRDTRTKYAFILALAGSLLVLYSVYVGGGKSVYYSGTLLIFIGVWLNASLLYILDKLRSRLKII
jgi:hypothetical protein